MAIRFTKKDIVLRHYDGAYRPVVDVKIHAYRGDFSAQCAKVAADNGDTSGRFTQAWIDAHVTDRVGETYYSEALTRAWEQLQEDINAEEVFDAYSAGRVGVDAKHTVTSYGRSSGWAGIAQFTADDVTGWDARAVARWAKFARFARETADDVPYQYMDMLYHNVFLPWAEEDAFRAERIGKAGLRLTLNYQDGSSIDLDLVRSLTIVGPRTVEIACFGNDPVTHRNVLSFTPEKFEF